MSHSCTICYDNYEENTDNCPKIMSCGDTFCFKCLKKIKKEKEKFNCPICQKEIFENIEDMPTNRYVFNPKKNILCDICLSEFDDIYNSEHSPKVLECGDTFCSKCLKSSSSSEIICYFCGKKTNGNVDDLRVNKIIIEKLKEKIINKMEISEVDYTYSVGLIGENGGGKTSISYFFKTGKIIETTMDTIGFDSTFKYIKCKEKTVKLSLIDTSGQEKFLPITAGALKDVYGVLLVFSLTPIWSLFDSEKYEISNEEERDKIREEYTEETFDKLTFWLNQFRRFNTRDNSIIYLIGNKVDDEKDRIINYKDIKKFAVEHNLKYYETSAKIGTNINKVFYDLIIDLMKIFPNKIEKKNINLNKGSYDAKRNNKKCY